MLKKKIPNKFYCSQFTIQHYCSHFTVHRLLFTIYCSSFTVHLSCNTICLLQYTSSSVLQYNTPSLAIPLISLAIHFHFPCNAIPFLQYISSATTAATLQYNSLYCNTILNLLHPYIAIPCNTLQYNSSAYLQASMQYNSLYCNTIFQPLSSPIAIQLLPTSYIAIHFLSQNCTPTLPCHNTNFLSQHNWAVAQFSLHQKKKIVFFQYYFQLLEIPKKNIHNFFSRTLK